MKKNWSSGLSRQVANKRLNATDFYPTPMWCVENLEVDWSKFNSMHEPCKGDGRILDWFTATGIKTTYTEILENLDFFDWSGPTDLVFTNPPFSLAQEFIDHSIANSNTVFMLLRINYLGAIKRYEWWKKQPPTALYVLSKRPSFTGSGTDATDYAWFVWDKTDRITPGIHFVKPPSKEQADRDNATCKAAIKALETKNTLA